MAQLGSKDSSRNLHMNCTIGYFCPYLILRECVQTFEVKFLAKNFLDLNKTLATPLAWLTAHRYVVPHCTTFPLILSLPRICSILPDYPSPSSRAPYLRIVPPIFLATPTLGAAQIKYRNHPGIDRRRNCDGMMPYVWWNIWKECNWRTFQHTEMTTTKVAQLIRMTYFNIVRRW